MISKSATMVEASGKPLSINPCLSKFAIFSTEAEAEAEQELLSFAWKRTDSNVS